MKNSIWKILCSFFEKVVNFGEFSPISLFLQIRFILKLLPDNNLKMPYNLIWNQFWETLEKLEIETLRTILVISKTVKIHKGFEIAWKLPWLYEHSLPIRFLSIILKSTTKYLSFSWFKEHFWIIIIIIIITSTIWRKSIVYGISLPTLHS